MITSDTAYPTLGSLPGRPHGFGVQPGHDAERAQALIQEFILQRNLDA